MVNAAGSGQQGNLQWLIMQQMQIMQQQLAAMSGMAVQESPVQAPATSAVPAPVPHSSSSGSESEKAELEKPFGAIARIENR
jgi:hypothetical protein